MGNCDCPLRGLGVGADGASAEETRRVVEPLRSASVDDLRDAPGRLPRLAAIDCLGRGDVAALDAGLRREACHEIIAHGVEQYEREIPIVLG